MLLTKIVVSNWWHRRVEKVAKELEESGMDDRESVGSGRQWMKKFSKMKVGPPKGVKTVID